MKIPLLKLFTKLRVDLNDDPTTHTVLELKQNSTGIVSWSTRGQLECSVVILATTDFQSNGYTNEEMVSIFKDTLKSPLNEFEYTQSRIRSAKDVLKKGGHVTLNLRDKKIRLL